jgi:hypothetical protein
VPVGTVLGYALAHEVGHLLLHTGQHAVSGIMKAHWTAADRVSLAGKRMNFNGHEAASMRRQLRAAARPSSVLP